MGLGLNGIGLGGICFGGLFREGLKVGDSSFFFWGFYYLWIYLDARYRLLFELLRLLTFLIDDRSRSIFSLKVSAKVDFLNTPMVEHGIVLLVPSILSPLPPKQSSPSST